MVATAPSAQAAHPAEQGKKRSQIPPPKEAPRQHNDAPPGKEPSHIAVAEFHLYREFVACLPTQPSKSRYSICETRARCNKCLSRLIAEKKSRFFGVGLRKHLNLQAGVDINFQSLYGVRVSGCKSANRHNRRGNCCSSRGRQARTWVRESGSGQDRFPPGR